MLTLQELCTLTVIKYLTSIGFSYLFNEIGLISFKKNYYQYLSNKKYLTRFPNTFYNTMRNTCIHDLDNLFQKIHPQFKNMKFVTNFIEERSRHLYSFSTTKKEEVIQIISMLNNNYHINLECINIQNYY